MERKINYRKRRKGLLASVICVALLMGLLYPPMVVQAVSAKSVSVTGEDTTILVGEGDSITFGNGMYGNIAIEDSYVFPTSGNESVEIRSGGQWSGTLFATGKSYTVPASNGLYVQDAIDFYTYTELYSQFSAQSGYFYPSTVDYSSSNFTFVTLRSVAGCKVDYMNDSGTVVRTDYVLADGTGTATEVWDGLTKANAELLGWSTSANADAPSYELNASLLNENGLLVLYPVWETTAEPEPKPEPAKSTGKVSVSMSSYIYGGSASSPQISSSTNDVSKATVEYKTAGADDSTYGSQKPTAVGNYTVRVTLPSNDDYSRAVGTADFNIRYLSAPSPAYELDGAVGDSGWYKSEVEISAPEGYEMSVGSRDNFTTEAYVVDEETTNLRIYLRKTATGEQTDMISIANLRVDAQNPEVKDVKDGDEVYADEFQINFEETNLKTVSVDGKEVEVTENEDGSYAIALEAGMRRLTHTVLLKDEAGNETKVSLIVGPAWLKDGIIGEGNYYLETGEEYHTPEGSEWTMSGDKTVYSGGIGFYANSEGEVTFTKE